MPTEDRRRGSAESLTRHASQQLVQRGSSVLTRRPPLGPRSTKLAASAASARDLRTAVHRSRMADRPRRISLPRKSRTCQRPYPMGVLTRGVGKYHADIRYRCTRSIITMSARECAIKVGAHQHRPALSTPGGSSVRGCDQDHLLRPAVLSSSTIAACRRKCVMSPTIATVLPSGNSAWSSSERRRCRRIVKMHPAGPEWDARGYRLRH